MKNLPQMLASVVNDVTATVALLRQARAAAHALLGRDANQPAVNPFPKSLGGLVGLVQAEMAATADAFSDLRDVTASVVGSLGVEDAPPVDASPEDDEEPDAPPPLPTPDDDDAADLPSDDDLRDPSDPIEDDINDDTILTITTEGRRAISAAIIRSSVATPEDVKAVEAFLGTLPAPEQEAPSCVGSVAAQVAEVEAPAYEEDAAEPDAVAIPFVHSAEGLHIRQKGRRYKPATETDLFSGADLFIRDEIAGRWIKVEYRPH